MKYALTLLLTLFIATFSYSQSQNACTSQNCSGFGSPVGACTGSLLYADISTASPTLYACKSNQWIAVSSSGGGGGLSSFTTGNLSPLFTVALGANPTIAPAQVFTPSTAAQNSFLAGPGSGGTGSYSFRAIIAADIPTLNQNTSGNAATATAFQTAPSQCSTSGQVPTGIDINGNAINCFTPSGGGGGNTTSSSLTSGFFSIANGANSIVNSHLDDGATTVGVITSSEPVSVPRMNIVDLVNNAQVTYSTGTGGDSTLDLNTTANSFTNGIQGGIPVVSIGPSGAYVPYLTSANVTAGANVTVTPSATGITISATATGGGGTIPNTTDFLIGGASNTATDSGILPSSVALLSGGTFTGAIQTIAGTAATPGLVVGTSGTGLFNNSGALAFATSGVVRGEFSGAVLSLGASSVAFGGSVGTNASGLSQVATGVIGVGTGAAGSVTGTLAGLRYESAVGTAIASATTIAPTSGITHITGTTAIATITTPTGMSSTMGGCLTLVADGAWTTTTTGNIFAAMTAVAGTPYVGCYDGSKWYIK